MRIEEHEVEERLFEDIFEIDERAWKGRAKRRWATAEKRKY